jgi:hypothetical protein
VWAFRRFGGSEGGAKRCKEYSLRLSPRGLGMGAKKAPSAESAEEKMGARVRNGYRPQADHTLPHAKGGRARGSCRSFAPSALVAFFADT